MPVYQLDEELWLPRPELAEPDGLLAVGGDLSPERLVLAYANGIFPWYSEGQPILWHSPDPRMVLEVERLHVPRSLGRALRRGELEVRLDERFAEVIDACARKARPGQDGTWITAEIREAYVELHRRGLAHSAETYREGQLVGGLYGVSLGAAFFGESMFSEVADASKVAFVRLLERLREWEIGLIDCQVHSEHLERFGAEPWPRARFLEALAQAVARPTRPGPWT